MPAMPRVHAIVSMPFEENSYVVWLPGRTDAVVFDPGLEPELIVDFLKQEGLTPAALINTHGHADHIGGNEHLKRGFPQAPIIIGVNEAIMLTSAQANLSAAFGLPITSPAMTASISEP